MAEILGPVVSLTSTIDYGLELATALHTYAEGLPDTKENICDIAVDVNTTATVLGQLRSLMNADHCSATQPNNIKIFKDDGLKEIETLARQCGRIYMTIVILITKAGKLVSKGKSTASLSDMPVLRASDLLRTLRWQWLEPRIKRSQELLKWLKMKVLLNLQLASLAKVQLG
jgi:hypothetical protein